MQDERRGWVSAETLAIAASHFGLRPCPLVDVPAAELMWALLQYCLWRASSVQPSLLGLQTLAAPRAWKRTGLQNLTAQELGVKIARIHHDCNISVASLKLVHTQAVGKM